MMRFSLNRIQGKAEELRELDRIFQSLPPDIAAHVGTPTAASEWNALPPGVSRENKIYFLISDGAEAAGCVELIRGFPDDETVFIGLMAVHAERQRRGLGSMAWDLVEETIRSWGGIRRIRLGVSEEHEPAVRFWIKMGFLDSGERRVAANVTPAVTCRMFEKVFTSPDTQSPRSPHGPR